MNKISTLNNKGVIDLVIDNNIVTSHETHWDSYEFWEKVSIEAERAMYKLRQEHPRCKYESADFKSKESKRNVLIKELQPKYPNVDIPKLYDIIDESVLEIKPFGTDDNHPNPFMKFRIDSDIVKSFIAKIIFKLK